MIVSHISINMKEVYYVRVTSKSTRTRVKKQSSAPTPARVVLIERTDKRFKIIILNGAILFWLGIILIIFSLYQYYDLEHAAGKSIVDMIFTLQYASLMEEQPEIKIAFWGVVLGFIIKRFGRALAWWYHG